MKEHDCKCDTFTYPACAIEARNEQTTQLREENAKLRGALTAFREELARTVRLSITDLERRDTSISLILSSRTIARLLCCAETLKPKERDNK